MRATYVRPALRALGRHHEKAPSVWDAGPSAGRASRRTLPPMPTKTTNKQSLVPAATLAAIVGFGESFFVAAFLVQLI